MFNIYFTSPIYFILLIPFLFFLYFLYKVDKKDVNFLFIKDLKNIYKNDSYFYKLKYALIFLILVLFLSILAKPVTENRKEIIKKNWIDIEIILDVSYSMIATDLKPNRLEVAKDVIVNFLDKIKTDRVWIIVFAWKPFTSLPLTYDYNILKDVIKNINVDTINQNVIDFSGTAIWDALILGNSALNHNEGRQNVIILLTDWEANTWLDPLLALKLLKENKIKVYSIWIWWEEKTEVIFPTIFWNQVVEIWWVDEETLKTISNETSWKYFRADTKKTFEDIFDEISLLEKSDIEVEVIKEQNRKDTIFLYLLIISMITLSILIYKKG